MGERTAIEWADSTVNAQMGCDGCELWNPRIGLRRCYAGVLTERRTVNAPRDGAPAGWPASFDRPTIFPGRIAKAARWKDLTGTKRQDKPWLDGSPRVIFLDDMGDTFTESLPIDWLAPELPVMAASPHLWLILTKRPHRFAAFAERHPLPPNVWAGTSVTDHATRGRIGQLLQVRASMRFLSVEPLIGRVDLCEALGIWWNQTTGRWVRSQGSGIGWVIVGGESGPGARPCDLAWLRSIVAQCRAAAVPVFVKQLGARPGEDIIEPPQSFDAGREGQPITLQVERYRLLNLRDRKGGDIEEWPEDLRVREFPQFHGLSSHR